MHKRNTVNTLIISLLWAGLLTFQVNGFSMSKEPEAAPGVAPLSPGQNTTTIRAPLSFVINESSNIAVEITIPDRFAPLVGEDKVLDAIKRGLVEYKPKSDFQLSHWTELLTIIPLSGTSGLPAYTFRDSVLAELKGKTNAFVTVNSAFKNEKDYQVATAIARYQLNGRTEILYFYAISGPARLVSVQYIKAISPKEDLPQLINQLSALFAKNVKIIK